MYGLTGAAIDATNSIDGSAFSDLKKVAEAAHRIEHPGFVRVAVCGDGRRRTERPVPGRRHPAAQVAELVAAEDRRPEQAALRERRRIEQPGVGRRGAIVLVGDEGDGEEGVRSEEAGVRRGDRPIQALRRHERRPSNDLSG
jgi:hypothetical protein